MACNETASSTSKTCSRGTSLNFVTRLTLADILHSHLLGMVEKFLYILYYTFYTFCDYHTPTVGHSINKFSMLCPHILATTMKLGTKGATRECHGRSLLS